MDLAPDMVVLRRLRDWGFVVVMKVGEQGIRIHQVPGIQEADPVKLLWDLHRRGLLKKSSTQIGSDYHKTCTVYRLSDKGAELLKRLGL